jgi:glutamate synthase domain-containing protein 2/ferredoxin
VAEARYHIHTEVAPPRRAPIPKYLFERSRDCVNCGWCIRACIYDVHSRLEQDIRSMADTVNYLCKNCFRCLEECPRRALAKRLNPEYQALGDGYYTPDIIDQTWYQAETSRIPVRGGGYRGLFAGRGFDAMWTDMSEIVRPTRDGIHGREYISTAVALGRKPSSLEFDASGRLLTEVPPLLSIPFPVVFNPSPFGVGREVVQLILVKAAARLGTFAIVDADSMSAELLPYAEHIAPRLSAASLGGYRELIERARLVELDGQGEVAELVGQIRASTADTLISVRFPFHRGSKEAVKRLVGLGVDIVHLYADRHGREVEGDRPRFIKEALLDLHRYLVEKGLRDEITILASGGIAHAEHVPKAMICGADAVAIDIPLLIALEYRFPELADHHQPHPSDAKELDPDWGVQRIMNLMCGWRDQLLEILGAMGMREARRLRGEMGRAIFLEEAEKEAFGDIKLLDKEVYLPPIEPTSVAALSTFPKVEIAAPKYRLPLGRYRVLRSDACIGCGTCQRLCPYGVHERREGYNRMLLPKDWLCIGVACQDEPFFCIDHCPRGALSLEPNLTYEALGDLRWTPDLILSTWEQAEYGEVRRPDREHRIGASGGGFDRLRFAFLPEDARLHVSDDEVSTAIELNRRSEGPRIRIPIPVYGAGMSFGSTSLPTMLARARAAQAWGTFLCTGEGGYPEELQAYDDHIITQVATGLFGVQEETIQRVRIIEFKYAQGAKPGLGGHLLGDKVTAAVAQMRESVPGVSLFSPFPFHSVYSVEDHKKHVDWIKSINPEALIAVKVSTPTDVDMVAVGSYYAGANIIHLDGSYGGTGAAPEIAKKNIAMPIEYGITKVHRFLTQEGIRDEIVLIASGGIRTAYDVAKAIALGADGAVIGTAELVALGCVRCGNCESGRGCPRGIATTDPELSELIDVEWGAQRIINLYASWRAQWVEILKGLGLRSIEELRGRTDLLRYTNETSE